MPTITIPGFGASLDSFAISIQSFLGWGHRLTIPGEFTINDGKLWLVVRTNYRVTFASDQGADLKKPIQLLDQAAIRLFDAAEPVLGAMSHNNFGSTKDREDQPNEAIAQYRKTIELDPEHPAAYSNLGNVLSDQGKLDEAILEFRKAIELDPAYANAPNGLGNALSNEGKLDEAVTEYRVAIHLSSQDALPHNGLGNVFSQQGNLDEAAAEYRRDQPGREIRGAA